MRAYAYLVALATATRVASHPLCFIDDRPTDYDQTLTYCGDITDIDVSGACCTDLEEAQVEANFNAAFAEGVEPSVECAALYKEVGRPSIVILFVVVSGVSARTLPFACEQRSSDMQISVGKQKAIDSSLFFSVRCW